MFGNWAYKIKYRGKLSSEDILVTQEDSSRLVCFFMNSKMEKVPKSTVSFLDAPKHKLKLMLVKFEKASICIYNILIFSVGGQTNPGGSRPVVAEIIWWQACSHTSTTKNSAEQQRATLPPDMSGGRSGAQLGIAGGPARAEPQRQRAAVRSRSGLLGAECGAGYVAHGFYPSQAAIHKSTP